MVSMLTSSVVDNRFEHWEGQTKDNNIGICCFTTTKHATLKSKNKDLFSWNHDNVSLVERHVYLQFCYRELALLKSNSAC